LSLKLAGAFIGTFYGSCVNLWYPDPTQEISTSKKFGAAVMKTEPRAWFRGLVRPAVWFTAVGSSFAVAECFAEVARNKRDSLNAGFGGVVAGAVMGSISRRADLMVSSAIGCGILMFGMDYSTSNIAADRGDVFHKMYDTLPEKHEESATLRALKEKYQEFKDN